jgi:hypothetical protein
MSVAVSDGCKTGTAPVYLDGTIAHFGMSHSGQKSPKQLRLPAGKTTHEHLGRIVPEEDLRLLRLTQDASAVRSVALPRSREIPGVGEKP